ncbi:MAG: glycosyltransferase family 4 protein [Chloracidobacterium sp.]|nr:glycosyltransferase family 4 protein [Chloracidobacterium sp.]MDW8216358.1 glycosyltransferase family 4 protein [Acidobacteriota bacterium]
MSRSAGRANPLRVLYLLDSLNRGGVETLTLATCQNAATVGIEAYVAGFGDGNFADAFHALPRSFFHRRRAPFDPRLAGWLRRLIQTQAIDLIHANQAVEALHAWWARRGLPAKLVLTLHNLAYDAKNRRALNFLLPRVDAVTVVSEAARSRHEADGMLRLDCAQRVAVIPNGVPDPARPAASAADAPATGPILGMIANFTPIKDHATLCRALPEVFQRRPTAQCVFVGAAQDERLYREARAICARGGLLHRVHFWGARPAADVLPKLDVFVLSSHSDTFGLALVEAMLAGVPCAASDIPALREVTADGTAAALFRAGDSVDCARVLNQLLDDLPYRRTLAARGQAHARRRYTLAAYLNRLRDFYDRVIAL